MSKPGKPYHLLVVDDDKIYLNSLIELLKNAGYSVSGAQNARMALDEIKSDTVDLILLDIQMPQMDGVDLVEHLRSKGNRKPIIMMTAYGDVSTYLKGKELGITEYLTKPVTAKKLLAIIKTVLKESCSKAGYQHS